MASEVSSSSEVQAHLRILTLLSLLSRVLIAVLVISSTYLLPLFDSSPRLVLNAATPPWISSLLRWDAFHFALVAEQGHAYEHTWAFFPALPLIMRLSGHLLSRAGLSSPDTTAPLLGGAILAVLFDPTRVLYRLSLHHLRSPSAAFLAAALSLLSSSPATLRFAPYNEPFFTYCSYRGMWACARTRWVSASVWFALASAFRSNGVLLSGFVVWGMLVVPYLSGRRGLLTPARILYCTVLVAIPLVPFVHHNYRGYVLFCTATVDRRPEWCDRGLLPSIYAHVQRAYWNVGFLRYWTVSNAPNFLLALPILGNVYAFCGFYLSRVAQVYPGLFVPSSPGTPPTTPHPPSLFLAPSLLPHVLHAVALVLLLTFNAHVQIALRVLPSLPLVYWGAAWLLVERPWWGRAWVAWSVVWGAVNCVLWAVFLPPA
ncbi:GPI mannosyltransferase 2 [Boletus edulis BED1]|uniref:GPI mannosyltransferase 2 n=1 Tax=Boletus edulis BED1 TaxID=1328754 RepID=A0AAD4GJC2_BOLED|nr:GPI mannosyltransferase 2 [Boletus edulis BED1]